MDLPSSHRSHVPKWVSEYERDWWRLDVLAGLTSAAVVIPRAMAAEETQRKQGVSLWLVGLNPVCCKLSKGRL